MTMELGGVEDGSYVDDRVISNGDEVSMWQVINVLLSCLVPSFRVALSL